MSEEIVPQDGTEVKQECEVEGCCEDAWRDRLCWFHSCEERIAEWDAQDAERQAALEGVGYVFGDHTLDTSWYGYAKEVLA